MGIAQKLYAKYQGAKEDDRSLEFFDSVDLECARKCCPQGNDNHRLLVGTLSQAVRQGHLCLSIGDEIVPNSRALWDSEEIELEAALRSAAKSFPESPHIHRVGNRFYFAKFWSCESLFAEHFKRLQMQTPSIALDPETVNKQLSLNPNLLPEQAYAIKLACERSVSIITGGPGTGKTYTAGVLIQILWNSMDPQQRDTARFVLAAPTGKAAINLQKSIERFCSNIPHLKAKTLHSLLRMSHLSADVILVDESSMIDVQIMARLFSSVKNGARLILLGDSHQLPPVEAGSLFTDMIAHMQEVGELSQCLRAELKGIRDLSESIYRGDVDKVMAILNASVNGVERLEFPRQLIQEIADYAIRHQIKLTDFSYESIKTYLESFCLLSPLRRGLLGVDHLNQKIFEAQKNLSTHPILITKNDASLELFNGDTGVLVNGDYALFLGSDETVKKIPALLLPPYEYAYCLSVHKSQGSEFNHVALLMPEGSQSFGSEVFYTGVTRAKKHISIWGSDDALQATVKKKTYRHSGLK